MHCQSRSSDGGLLARERLPLGKGYSGRGLAVDPVVSSLDGEKRAEDFPAKQYLSSDDNRISSRWLTLRNSPSRELTTGTTASPLPLYPLPCGSGSRAKRPPSLGLD